MEEDKNKECCNWTNWSSTKHGHFHQSIYGLGFIGALIYFIQHATTFWIGVLGVLKAIVWPVFIVYKLLELLKL